MFDHFKADKAHLVGLSMGGRIARNFALEHPDRLRSLTLANTTPGFDALSPEEVRRFVDERRNRTADSLRSLVGSRAAPEALPALQSSFAALRPGSYLKTLEASVAQDRAAPIEQIRVPTLVVTGTEDKVYAPQIARDMAQRIPGAELAVLEGAGHLTNLELPDEFNRRVMEFALKQETRR